MSSSLIDTFKALGHEKQRQFELAPGQTWTPFLEEVNDLMIEEKVSRHENDGVKTSEICLRIVSDIRERNSGFG